MSDDHATGQESAASPDPPSADAPAPTETTAALAEAHTAPAAPSKPVEEWRDAKGHTGPSAWKFAAALASKSWLLGRVVTESEYDAAVEYASNVSLGYNHPKPGDDQ